MSVFAIGDVHGCLDALKIAFSTSNINQHDTLILLGDLIDRGPDSKGVIDFIIQLKRDGYTIIILRGNHESMMLRALNDQSVLRSWLMYGGDETLDSYGVTSGFAWEKDVPKAHWALLTETLRYVENDTHIFVHAGLEPNVALDKQTDKALLWQHLDQPIAHCSGKTVVVGHTAQTNGKINHWKTENYLFLDTYCYQEGWLSCVNIDTGDYVQANQNKQVRKGTIIY